MAYGEVAIPTQQGDRGTDQVLIRGRNETPFFVLDGAFQVGFLFRSLQEGPSDAAAIDLLELQILGEVMIEGGFPEV